MADVNTFHCSVITPERKVLDCEAGFVAFPAHDGEMGVLRHRAPLICKLGIGVMRVGSPSGEQTFYIDGGFAQMLANKLTILTEQARSPKEISPQAVEKAKADAAAMRITDEASFTAKARATARAQAQQRLLAHPH